VIIVFGIISPRSVSQSQYRRVLALLGWYGWNWKNLLCCLSACHDIGSEKKRKSAEIWRETTWW